MVIALDSGLSGQGSKRSSQHCVEILYSHCASLYHDVKMDFGEFNAGSIKSHPGGVEILLINSCCRPRR